MFLFYKKIEKYEGMDMAMDMVKKYLDDERVTTDFFNETEDLLWTSKFCPRTIFFRTAVLLLKMRVYEVIKWSSILKSCIVQFSNYSGWRWHWSKKSNNISVSHITCYRLCVCTRNSTNKHWNIFNIPRHIVGR